MAAEHPEILFQSQRTSATITAVEGQCGAQANGAALKGCVFWDAMIASGAWSSVIPQVRSLEQRLKRPDGLFSLPDVKVEVLSSVITASEPNPKADKAELETQLCARQRWSDAETYAGCIVEAVPVVGQADGSTREYVIRQKLIKIVFEVPQDRADAVRATLQRAFALPPEGAALSRGFIEQDLKVRALFQAAAPTCADGDIKGSMVRARQAIDWPNVHTDKAKDDAMLILDPGEQDIGDQLYVISSSKITGGDWPSDVVGLVGHPVFAEAPAWSLSCGAMLTKPPGGRLAHSMAVASIALGQNARIDLSDGSSANLSPFFSPARVMLGLTTALYPNSNAVAGSGAPRVVVASYQHQAPKPAGPDKPGPPTPPKVRDYRTSTNGLMMAGNIVVAAAPVLEPGASAPDLDAEPTDNFLCDAWPACLDSLGWTLTVAALDRNGGLLTKEPVSGQAYELTARTVSVAAAGDQLPVVALTQNGPTLAFASGTSLAAPAVGALALKMRETLSAPRQAYDIITAIQSTADLSRNFDGRIRFGVVNATRALAIVGAAPGQTLVYPVSSDERSDAAASPQAVTVKGIAPPKKCKVAQADVAAGVLLFYRPGDPDTDLDGATAPPTCVPVKYLLRVRQSGFVDGKARFTIVFSNPKIHMNGRIYAEIARDVLLEPIGLAKAYCMTALGDPSSTVNPPCLTTVGPGSVAVDLINQDLVFHPSSYEVR